MSQTNHQQQYQIFLSHKSQEKDIADVVHKSLLAALPGTAIFYSPRAIPYGKKVVDEIRNALSRKCLFIPIVSPLSLDARWINLEFGAALVGGFEVFPVLVLGLKPEDPRLPKEFFDYTCVYKHTLDEVETILVQLGKHIGCSTDIQAIQAGAKQWVDGIQPAKEKARREWISGGLTHAERALLDGDVEYRSEVLFYTRPGDKMKRIPSLDDSPVAAGVTKTLWLTGNTLEYWAIHGLRTLHASLRNKGAGDRIDVEIILPDPFNPAAMRMAQDWDHGNIPDVPKKIQDNFDIFFARAEDLKETMSIRLRLCSRCPLHSIVAVDADQLNGVIQIDVVAYGYREVTSPIFRLRADDPITEGWYEYFCDEWKKLREWAPEELTRLDWEKRKKEASEKKDKAEGNS